MEFDLFGNMTTSNESTTLLFGFQNTTTEVITRGPAPTPPPVGYYGDTRKALWTYLPPIIMTWGTIGNILTFLVILRQMKTLTSTSIYLMTLAVSDTVVLYTGLLRNWIKTVYDIDVRDITEAGCRAQVYITYASLHMSSWLLVAVSVERAVCVVIPHKVKLTCTKNKAWAIIVTIFVVVFGANSVLPVIHGLKGVQNQKCSLTTTAFLEFRDNIWQWIDFCMAFAVPFIILLVCNSIILIYVHRSKAARKRTTATGSRSKSSSDRNTTSVSLLMVSLCVIFFLTMTPASIFAVYYPYKFDEIQLLFRSDPHAAWYDYQYLMFQHTVVTIVSYTNAAFNFILYVFSGTKFRNELWSMFTCHKPGKHGMMESKAKTASSYITTSKSSISASETIPTISISQDPLSEETVSQGPSTDATVSQDPFTNETVSQETQPSQETQVSQVTNGD